MNGRFRGLFKVLCNQIRSGFKKSEIACETTMRRVSATLDRASFSCKTCYTDQLVQATLRATNFLAVACLFFGTGCAALVPESLEQRLGSLFLYALIPSVAFYGGGYILSLMLGATNELCEMLTARCFRCGLHLLHLVSSWLVPLLPPLPTCLGS